VGEAHSMNTHTIHPYHAKLERILDRMGGLYTLHDILTEVAQGKMQSFTHNESWMITRVMDYPRGRCLEVFAVVGNLDDCLAMHDKLLDFANEIGASVIQAYGRKGWLKPGKARGWRVKARSFVYQRTQ
jgi:hypothetical protein